MNYDEYCVNDLVIYENHILDEKIIRRGTIIKVYEEKLLVKFNNEELFININNKNLYKVNYCLNKENDTKFIKVLVVKPFRIPTIEYVENSLSNFQHIVGGLIEIVMLDNQVDLLCNEEGKLISLNPNRKIGEDIIAGTFILLSSNSDGEFISLNNEKLLEYYNRFERIEIYTPDQMQNNIMMRFIEI